MSAELDNILDQYDRGKLNRRQLLKGLAIATGGAMSVAGTGAAQAASAPIANAMSINHVHLLVKDVARSAEFYQTVLGAKPQGSRPPNYLTMYLPGAKEGFGSWITLSTPTGKRTGNDGGDDGKPGVISHAAYGVTFPTTEFPRIAKEIKARYPDVRDPNAFVSKDAGNGLYFFDLDGISTQLIQIEHNGALGNY